MKNYLFGILCGAFILGGVFSNPCEASKLSTVDQIVNGSEDLPRCKAPTVENLKECEQKLDVTIPIELKEVFLKLTTQNINPEIKNTVDGENSDYVNMVLEAWGPKKKSGLTALTKNYLPFIKDGDDFYCYCLKESDGTKMGSVLIWDPLQDELEDYSNSLEDCLKKLYEK